MSRVTNLRDMDCINYEDYCENGLDAVSKCPICQYSILPDLNCEVETEKYVYVICTCPHCKEIFIIRYMRTNRGYISGQIDCVFPREAEKFLIDDKIAAISPMFVKIFNQGLKAEAENLDEIVGIGYRKALEYLIKDYLILKKPEEEEIIKTSFLGKCIDMIENVNIRNMAKGATWLGNDETHYVKKWENKDIKDLKNMIDLTLSWMSLEIKTEEYKKEMNL